MVCVLFVIVLFLKAFRASTLSQSPAGDNPVFDGKAVGGDAGAHYVIGCPRFPVSSASTRQVGIA